MSEAQVVSLACPSGALLAGQSSMGCAGHMPGHTAAWVGGAWNALWDIGMACPRLGKDTAGP